MVRIEVLLVVSILAIMLAASISYAETPTGYFLPKGYKVTAQVFVPCAPFWPGEAVGDAVGLQTNDYSVIARGYGLKGGVLEGFTTRSGVKIIWVQGGVQSVKADTSAECNKKHEVTIVYSHDGQIKFSVGGRFIYSFVATADRYSIVAEGASVNAPEVLPRDTTSPAGGGYNPPSIQQIQIQALALGLGLGLGAIALILLLARRR